MLPFAHKIAFLLFAVVTVTIGLRGFYRVYRRIRRGSQDSDARFDHLPQRLWYALVTTLTQSRTFRRRPAISFFHSFIFYGFVFYILVNMVDAVEGFVPFTIRSVSWPGIVYNLLADLLSALVLIGVVALVVRRFLLPSRRDFAFNQRTMLHQDIKHSRIRIDSLIVSTFILFHVGSRAVGAGAKLAAEGPDRFQPFASLLSHAFTSGNAEAWRIFGFWGALGSVLAFLMYFPFSKHIHIFAAPAKYLAARRLSSGVLPAEDLDLESENAEGGRKQAGGSGLAPTSRCLRLHPVQSLSGCLSGDGNRQSAQPIGSRDQQAHGAELACQASAWLRSRRIKSASAAHLRPLARSSVGLHHVRRMHGGLPGAR